MEFVVLVAPFLIVSTMIIGLICICCKRIWVGLIFMATALIWNFYLEAVPFNLSFGKERGDLRVLAYNMYSSSDYYKSVEKDPADVVAMLIADDPDVIVLEEYFPVHCAPLRDSLLKYYPYFEYKKDHTYCSNAVFSRFPLSDWQELKIVPGANAEDDSLMNRAHELDRMRVATVNRSVSSVWIHHPKDSIRLIASHLSSNHFDQARDAFADTISLKEKIQTVSACFEAGQLERRVEVRHIMEQVKELRGQGKKVLVLGDKNDVAGSNTLKALREGNMLRNVWWERGFGLGLTFHAHRIMHFRIDHLLHSEDIKPKNIWVRDEPYSDHLPVLADFDLD